MAGTIRTYVDLQAAQQPEGIYLVAPEPGLTMTFEKLQSLSVHLSQYLLEQGLQSGDKVALLMHNGYQACRLFIGIMYSGRCVTPLNMLAQTSQLEYVLNHSDAKLVFVAADQVERLTAALRNVSREIKVVVCDVDAPEFLPINSAPVPLADVDAEDDALMMYTSGTTGQPKGVVLANRSVIAGGEFVSAAHALSARDRVLGSLPMYHINAQIVVATAALVHGGSIVLPHRFSASTFWQMVVEYKCTWINVVPTIIAYLLHAPDPLEAGLNLSNVRFCRSASAPLAPAQHREFEEKFGIGIIETMGLTETAAPAFTNPLDRALRKIGSPGQAFGNEAKIVDAAGVQLKAGEVGEIVLRGPNVMKGYYKNAPETSKTLSSDGWLRTGDLGYLDDDGFVFVTGRIKELIIKGGENIAPREIDEALLKHPAVLEAAAVGIPDVNYGQEILACIIVKAGHSCTIEELITFCKTELGPYKTPKVIKFVGELPKGPSGKVQRLKLLDLPD